MYYIKDDFGIYEDDDGKWTVILSGFIGSNFDEYGAIVSDDGTLGSTRTNEPFRFDSRAEANVAIETILFKQNNPERDSERISLLEAQVERLLTLNYGRDRG